MTEKEILDKLCECDSLGSLIACASEMKKSGENENVVNKLLRIARSKLKDKTQPIKIINRRSVEFVNTPEQYSNLTFAVDNIQRPVVKCDGEIVVI